MTDQDFVLGIDVGTSAIKVLAVDAAGTILASASAAHPVDVPQPGWSEQSPDQWYDATIEAIRRLLGQNEINPANLRAIGFAGQMHGLVTLDEALQNDYGPSAKACTLLDKAVDLAEESGRELPPCAKLVFDAPVDFGIKSFAEVMADKRGSGS